MNVYHTPPLWFCILPCYISIAAAKIKSRKPQNGSPYVAPTGCNLYWFSDHNGGTISILLFRKRVELIILQIWSYGRGDKMWKFESVSSFITQSVMFLEENKASRNHSEIIIGRNSMNDMICAEIGKACRLIVLLDSVFPSVMSVQCTYEQRWKPESRNAKNP